MDLLNDILNQVANLPTGALIIAAVIAAGYLIKANPAVPNKVIPPVTLAVAVTLHILLGDRSIVDYTVTHIEVRLGLVGVVYWAIGWLIHNQGLSRLEKFLPAPLRGLLGAEDKNEPPNVKDNQMKKLLMLLLLGASLTLETRAQDEPDFDWTAPNPPLPNTWYYFYGWDSTSNGIPPEMLIAEARRAEAPPPRPVRQTAANPERHNSANWVNSLSVSPYATVAFENFDEDQTGGVGLSIGAGISKAVSLVGFGEADDTEGTLVDRAGLGVRVTGRVTKALSLFGQMSGGYSFDDSAGLARDEWFIRPQFGGTLDFWRKGSAHVGLTGSWGLDVDLDGHTTQRLFGGLVAGTSF